MYIDAFYCIFHIVSSLLQISSRAKTDHSKHENLTKAIKETTPRENGMKKEPDCLIPSSSTDSNEKQDSIKESTSDGEVSADDSLVEELRRILREDDPCSELEEGQFKMSSAMVEDSTDKHYSSSDMIKLFTARPYFQSKRDAIKSNGEADQIETDHQKKEQFLVQNTLKELCVNNGESRSAEFDGHGNRLAEHNGLTDDYQPIDMDSSCKKYCSEVMAHITTQRVTTF